MKKFLFSVLALLFLAASAGAQHICSISTLDTCTGSSSLGTVAWVTDGEGVGDCVTGGGSHQHSCTRTTGGVWKALSSVPKFTTLHFTAFDEAADDLRCAGTAPAITARLCGTGAGIPYFEPYVGTPYIESATCRAFGITNAGAAQVVSIYSYYAYAMTGAQGMVGGTIDMETISNGDTVSLSFGELAPQSGGLLTLRAGFSTTGTGVFSLACNVAYYE